MECLKKWMKMTYLIYLAPRSTQKINSLRCSQKDNLVLMMILNKFKNKNLYNKLRL